MSLTRYFAILADRVKRMSRPASVLMGVVMLCAAGVFDWATGPEIALSIVYLVPITLMTWKAGRWPGLGVAAASGVVWLTVDLTTNETYTNPVIPFWNALVRTTIFCLVSGLMAEVIKRKQVEGSLRQTQEELERRVQERTAQLQALNSTLEQRVSERSTEAEERARKLVKSETDLQKQTDILQSILNSMGDGVVVVDSRGALVLINPAARRMLRIPVNNTDVRTWLGSQDTYLPSRLTEQPGRDNPLLRALQGETVDGAEMCLHHSDVPEGIWLSVTGRPLLDAAERISGGVVVFSDINARKELERQIAEVSDREQRRIGEDLHDGLCQHLVSIAFAARRLAAKLSERSLAETNDAAKIAELLGESISRARAVAQGLYLVQPEVGGLNSALEELAVRVQSQHQIRCHLIDKISVPILGEGIVTNLFRIAQEAVNNAVKHADASEIAITLSADEQQIRLDIEDDGNGFSPDREQTRGMGIHIMNYRTRMMGAALNIGQRPNGGTVVTCLVRRTKATQHIAHEQRD